jgi:hypothetical protein
VAAAAREAVGIAGGQGGSGLYMWTMAGQQRW